MDRDLKYDGVPADSRRGGDWSLSLFNSEQKEVDHEDLASHLKTAWCTGVSATS